MADRTIELYAAIFSALTGNSALAVTLGGAGRIFNAQAPADLKVPFVILGDATANDYGASDGDAQEHTLTIHAYAEEPGKKKSLEIMRDVRAVLHDADLSLSSGALINLRQEFSNTDRDPDGLSSHGVLRYRAVTQG